MKQQKITQVHHINDDDLTQTILEGVEQKLNSFKENFEPKKPTEWLTRKEVCNILSISLVTVTDWSKKGIITPYRIGNRIRFKRNEIESALTRINI